jgi:hypothetical protein
MSYNDRPLKLLKTLSYCLYIYFNFLIFQRRKKVASFFVNWATLLQMSVKVFKPLPTALEGNYSRHNGQLCVCRQRINARSRAPQ